MSLNESMSLPNLRSLLAETMMILDLADWARGVLVDGAYVDVGATSIVLVVVGACSGTYPSPVYFEVGTSLIFNILN